MRRFILALQFLTVIPFYKKLEVNEEDLGKSALYFPMVGLIIGGCLVCSNLLLSFFLPRSVVDGMLIVILVLITGSIHLDALADTVDGIASGKERNEKLRIMKDGQVGAMGAVAVFLVLMLKYLALAALPEYLKNQSLLLMPVMGRWSQVSVAYFSDYAGIKKGLGFPMTRHVTPLIFIFTTIISVLVAAYLFHYRGFIIAVLVVSFCLLYSLFFKRALGGVTGDVLGAANEITEVAVLFMILVNL